MYLQLEKYTEIYEDLRYVLFFSTTQLKTYCILDTQRILYIQTLRGCLF